MSAPSPPRFPLRRKLLFAALTTVLFFGTLELGLTALSAVVYSVRVARLNPDAPPRTGDGTVRIITLGDSLTAGQGTAPEYSYPRQLEGLLEQSNPGRRFEVFNLGVYALNSSRLADLLPGWMEEFEPDLVLVMAGCNNTWNYANSHLADLDLLDRSSLLALLDRTRTYRLLRLTLKRKRGPTTLVARPEPPLAGRMKLPADLAPLVDDTARTHERQERLFADPAALEELFNYDLALILQRVREGDGQLLLMTYPFQPDGFPHRAQLRRFAALHDVPVADVYRVFDELLRNRPELDPFSADRGHPNALGYGLVADTVYRVLAERPEVIGPLAPPPDPLGLERDTAYLEGVHRKLVVATGGDADEYTWEARGHVEVELRRWEEARTSFEAAYEISRGAPQFVQSLAWLYGLRGTERDLDGLVERTRRLRGERSDIEDIIEDVERARSVIAARRAGTAPKAPGMVPLP